MKKNSIVVIIPIYKSLLNDYDRVSITRTCKVLSLHDIVCIHPEGLDMEHILRLRGRNGAESIPMSETLRKMVEYRRDGKLWIVGFIADQVPMWNNIHLWLDFLHHDTPVFTGAERIARRFDSDVYYVDIRRECRGYYVARYELMAEHASTQSEGELTRIYFQYLEKSIRRQPPFYLWTHNRWKRTHEEYNIRYDEETGRVDFGDLEELKRRKGIV